MVKQHIEKFYLNGQHIEKFIKRLCVSRSNVSKTKRFWVTTQVYDRNHAFHVEVTRYIHLKSLVVMGDSDPGRVFGPRNNRMELRNIVRVSCVSL